MAVLHVKYRDRQHDIEMSDLFPRDRLAALGISDDSADIASLTNAQIREAVSNHLDIGENELNGYEIQRHDNGNATLRPEVVFG